MMSFLLWFCKVTALTVAVGCVAIDIGSIENLQFEEIMKHTRSAPFLPAADAVDSAGLGVCEWL
jgi:hypothetical protein